MHPHQHSSLHYRNKIYVWSEKFKSSEEVIYFALPHISCIKKNQNRYTVNPKWNNLASLLIYCHVLVLMHFWSCLEKDYEISQTVAGLLLCFLVPGWRISNQALGTPSVQHTVQQAVLCFTTAELPNPLSKMSRKQFSVFPLAQKRSKIGSKGFFFLVV